MVRGHGHSATTVVDGRIFIAYKKQLYPVITMANRAYYALDALYHGYRRYRRL